jgi:hypothetical protein
LPRPFGWQVAEPGDAEAVGQALLYGGPDEIGREECERDRHVPESLAFGDSIDANDWIIDQFIEPTAVLCD